MSKITTSPPECAWQKGVGYLEEGGSVSQEGFENAGAPTLNAEQRYWVVLGRGHDGGNYAQSLMDETKIKEWDVHTMSDNTAAVVIEVTYNPKTGATSSTLVKQPRTHHAEGGERL